MNTLKQIWLAFLHMVKQACLLPQLVARAVGQRRRQLEVNTQEAERLDGIRNPSKYRGK